MTGDGGGFTACTSNFDITATGDYVGGFSGDRGGGVDCYATGQITVSGSDYVGGFAGYGGSITGCTANVTINGTGEYCGGIVGYMYRGTIDSCHATVSINTGSYYYGRAVGGLVGYIDDTGTIVDCSSSGYVTGTAQVGGLLGHQRRSGSVERSHSSVQVNGTTYGQDTGGLVGLNEGDVTECFATGSVTGADNVGGLIGNNGAEHYAGQVSNCYATGYVSGTDSTGGFIGFNDNPGKAYNCYSTGRVVGFLYHGGFIGQNLGAVGGCYWDTITSQRSISQGGIGKTTTEMKMAATFVGWGSDGIWSINEGVSSPYLSWEDRPGETIPDVSYWSGDGTEQSPYLIYTADELYMLGLDTSAFDKHFKLMADIDLSGYNGLGGNLQFQPIGGFKGVFDGNGHTVSNLSITTLTQRNIGLFGSVAWSHNNTLIKDLGIIDPVINAPNSSDVGALAGFVSGDILRCYSQGGTITGSSYVGGLIGETSSGSIDQC